MAVVSGCSSTTESTSPSRSGGALVVPSIVNFDSVGIGQMRDTTVPFLNTSADSITITSNGLSSAEAQDTNFFKPFVIGANGFHNFHVQFDAAGNGIRTANDTIHYTFGGTSSTAIMTLTGTAAGGATGGGSGTLFVPTPVDFGMLPVGAWHDTTIMIANNGSAPLTITSSSLANGVEAKDTNFTRPVTLQANGYRMIHVQFNPSAAGLRTRVDTIRYSTGGTSAMALIVYTAQGAGGSTGGGKVPGPGSSFTFDTWQVDTNGNTSVHSDSTYTIVSNSMSYMGKTNVMAVRGPDGSVSYYNVAANGDISAYVDFSGSGAPMPSQWFTIPLGSKTEIKKTLFDSSITTTYQGLPVTLLITATSDAKYLGSPSITAAGKSFQTNNGLLAIVVSVSGFGGLISTTNTSTTNIWYSNTLGFYPKRQDVQASSGGFGQTATTSSANYLLKSDVIK